MPSNIKADNQYFGKYLERAVVEHINNTGIVIDPNQYYDLSGYCFSDQEITDLNKEAEKIAAYIGKNFVASYVGNHTSIECGDIILDDHIHIELKRVSSGSGTYHNTSIFFFKDYGFDFKDYMSQYGLYDTIEKYFPSAVVSRTNNSPVNIKTSSIIRHSNNEEGKKAIIQVDEIMRTAFVSDLAEYFINNPDMAYNFAKDMLNKVRLRTRESYKPDRFIVYNYNKDTITEISLQDIEFNKNNIQNTNLGLLIGPLRIQIGWQNGTGLNNPTIRVFLR
jgi:hypothetical protein